MKRGRRGRGMFSWQVILGIFLIALTTAVYYVHFLIFRDLHHILIYFLGDVAFVFTEVLLVALIINHLLHRREDRALINRLNMLTGAFFSEVGTELLRRLAVFDSRASGIAQKLAVPEDWSEREFLGIRESVKTHDSAVGLEGGDIESLKHFLRGKKQFLLDLLQNPSLIENESFTNLVWAAFHLTEELAHRRDPGTLTDAQRSRLTGDIARVYHLLIAEWVEYMDHLRAEYPYLFSLAARTNPFDGHASVDVK